MTYLVSYALRAYHPAPISTMYHKRGSFIVDGETCEEAATKARVILDDAVKYGVAHLRMPADVGIHIGSVLPTTPKEPAWEDVLDASAGRNRDAK